MIESMTWTYRKPYYMSNRSVSNHKKKSQLPHTNYCSKKIAYSWEIFYSVFQFNFITSDRNSMQKFCFFNKLTGNWILTHDCQELFQFVFCWTFQWTIEAAGCMYFVLSVITVKWLWALKLKTYTIEHCLKFIGRKLTHLSTSVYSVTVTIICFVCIIVYAEYRELPN